MEKFRADIVKYISEKMFKSEGCGGCKGPRSLKYEAFEAIKKEDTLSIQMRCQTCKSTKILKVLKGKFYGVTN